MVIVINSDDIDNNVKEIDNDTDNIASISLNRSNNDDYDKSNNYDNERASSR